jgi:hypothetical protein
MPLTYSSTQSGLGWILTAHEDMPPPHLSDQTLTYVRIATPRARLIFHQCENPAKTTLTLQLPPWLLSHHAYYISFGFSKDALTAFLGFIVSLLRLTISIFFSANVFAFSYR